MLLAKPSSNFSVQAGSEEVFFTMSSVGPARIGKSPGLRATQTIPPQINAARQIEHNDSRPRTTSGDGASRFVLGALVKSLVSISILQQSSVSLERRPDASRPAFHEKMFLLLNGVFYRFSAFDAEHQNQRDHKEERADEHDEVVLPAGQRDQQAVQVRADDGG